MFLNFEGKKTLINSYFYSNCNYCPLVWMFSNAKSLNKIESLQKRTLRFLYEDYVSSYEELLQKAGKETMKVDRSRGLCIEIYKSINNINPMYMNEIFKLRKTSRTVLSNYKLNLDVPTINQVSFGDKSLRYYGSKIWNLLPFHIKSFENLEACNNIIKKLEWCLLQMQGVSISLSISSLFLSDLRPIIEPCNIWVELSLF